MTKTSRAIKAEAKRLAAKWVEEVKEEKEGEARQIAEESLEKVEQAIGSRGGPETFG